MMTNNPLSLHETLISDFHLTKSCLKILELILIHFFRNSFQVVEGKHTVYRMSAAAEEDKLEWIKCLKQSISHNPFYDILVQRKKKALANS